MFVPGLQGLFLGSLGRSDWLGKNQDTHSLEEGRVALRVLWNQKAFSCGSDKITGVAELPAFRFPTEPREPGSGSPCCGQPAEDQALKSDSTPGMLSPLHDRGRVLTSVPTPNCSYSHSPANGRCLLRGARVTARVPPKRRE